MRRRGRRGRTPRPGVHRDRPRGVTVSSMLGSPQCAGHSLVGQGCSRAHWTASSSCLIAPSCSWERASWTPSITSAAVRVGVVSMALILGAVTDSFDSVFENVDNSIQWIRVRAQSVVATTCVGGCGAWQEQGRPSSSGGRLSAVVAWGSRWTRSQRSSTSTTTVEWHQGEPDDGGGNAYADTRGTSTTSSMTDAPPTRPELSWSRTQRVRHDWPSSRRMRSSRRGSGGVRRAGARDRREGSVGSGHDVRRDRRRGWIRWPSLASGG